MAASLPDDTFDAVHALPRVVSRNEALRRGYTRSAIEHAVRTGRWTRVLPRTYLTTDTLLWPDRCRAALAFAGPDAALTGAAALADLGLRGVVRPERLLVLVPDTTAVRSTGWVRIRRTRRLPERALRPGPRCAAVERAVADLALETRDLDEVRMLVAEVVRRRLCSIDDIAAELAAGPRNGSAQLRLAVEDVGGGSWSAPEARAARLLRSAGLGGFEQNARIDLADGTYCIVDFLWRRLRAVLEIDSDTHHALAGDADYTGGRHLRLEADGYSVVHRTPRHVVRQPEVFTASIADWLAGRAAYLR